MSMKYKKNSLFSPMGAAPRGQTPDDVRQKFPHRSSLGDAWSICGGSFEDGREATAGMKRGVWMGKRDDRQVSIN